MLATDFNRYIRIEKRVPSGDGFTWGLFKNAWARKLTGPGREYMASDQILAQTDARFEMPWTSGIDHTMRIVDGSDYWNISQVTIDDETGRDYLMIRVVGGTNKG